MFSSRVFNPAVLRSVGSGRHVSRNYISSSSSPVSSGWRAGRSLLRSRVTPHVATTTGTSIVRHQPTSFLTTATRYPFSLILRASSSSSSSSSSISGGQTRSASFSSREQRQEDEGYEEEEEEEIVYTHNSSSTEEYILKDTNALFEGEWQKNLEALTPTGPIVYKHHITPTGLEAPEFEVDVSVKTIPPSEIKLNDPSGLVNGEAFAVVHVGGAQYKVTVGDTIYSQKLGADISEHIVLDKVLMVGTKEYSAFGTPLLVSAKVTAEVCQQVHTQKVHVFKKKRRKGYKRWKGHKQPITILRITNIVFQPHRETAPAPEKLAVKEHHRQLHDRAALPAALQGEVDRLRSEAKSG
eukprot:TRINITY_DN112_c0_g1_i1.p1 TRINITY_DN112_c0_g1~~TRINITY_DN112_c0_g1_i1.p1  ORF type:complete len:354 (+),score=73.78 TRINITY_DN112_c0_g1_i1:165-1226(+)